jgi:hypothetical protein
MDGILNFFGSEAGQRRRAALNDLGRNIGYYIPPELRGLLGAAAEMTPTSTLERAARASQSMVAPDRTASERIGDLGTMLSETAGVVAPAMVANRAAMPAAEALQEGLLGFSVGAQDVGRAVVDRLNQPGEMPTLYSNPLLGPSDDRVASIRAYHGSPHQFDRFSSEAIGTGEGAQAYGRGLYFAEAEDVARSYRDNMLDARIPAINTRLQELSREMDEISTGYRQWRPGQQERGKMLADEYDSLMDQRSGMRGHLYEVNIQTNPEDFLDWDAPIHMQSESVQNALSPLVEERLNSIQAAGQRARETALAAGLPDFTPKSRERLLLEMRGGDLVGASRLGQFEQPIEPLLSQAGVPGIRYLDQTSRGVGEGSRNYVVFDENLINIVRRYGIAGAAALLGLSVADVESAMAGTAPDGLLAQEPRQ